MQWYILDIFHGPDNVYWFFSSFAQSIAALIGFLATGFFFIHDKLDKQAEADETLVEINADIKKRHFNILRWLMWCTGLSIVLSLLVVYFNGYNLGAWGHGLRILVAILNALTIFMAIGFVLVVVDPGSVDRTAKKLMEQNEDLSGVHTGRDNKIRPEVYLSKLFSLEQLLRAIYEKQRPAREQWEQRSRQNVSLVKVIRILYSEGLINEKQMGQLTRVTTIRNLAAHGKDTLIESRLGDLVDNLYTELRKKFPTIAVPDKP